MPFIFYLNLFFTFFSLWVALSPRYRTADTARNWKTFYFNLFAAALNGLFVLTHIYNWSQA